MTDAAGTISVTLFAGLILVNGVHAATDQALAAGDEAALFPPMGGG